VPRIEERRGTYKVLVGEPKETVHLEDVSVDGRIILKSILKKPFARAWIGLFWLRIETSGGLLCTRQ
jgi:hypothetical protein